MTEKEFVLDEKIDDREPERLLVRDVKEFIRRLKELPNAEGGFNCQCVPNEMIERGKGYTCEFCIGLNKLAGEKLT